jgi:hypothetical protein
MTRSQTKIAAIAGLVTGIAADQIIDPQTGLVGHMLVVLGAGGVMVTAMEGFFRMRRAHRRESTGASKTPPAP